MAAAPPPQPLSGGVLVRVHHRAHAHREEAVRLGEVDDVELDNHVADHSCGAGAGRSPVHVSRGRYIGRWVKRNQTNQCLGVG